MVETETRDYHQWWFFTIILFKLGWGNNSHALTSFIILIWNFMLSIVLGRLQLRCYITFPIISMEKNIYMIANFIWFYSIMSLLRNIGWTIICRLSLLFGNRILLFKHLFLLINFNTAEVKFWHIMLDPVYIIIFIRIIRVHKN